MKVENYNCDEDRESNNNDMNSFNSTVETHQKQHLRSMDKELSSSHRGE